MSLQFRSWQALSEVEWIVNNKSLSDPRYFSLNLKHNYHSSGIIELPQECEQILLMSGQQEWLLPNGIGYVCVRVEKYNKSTRGPNVITVTHEARLNPCILGKESYWNLLEIEKQLICPQARMILLYVL
jgi:hypothetical protein